MRHITTFLCAFLLMGSATVRSDEPSSDDSPLTVELISPGSMPRKELRFAPKAGDKETVVMTMKMSQAMSLDGNKMPAPALPGQKMTVEFAVKDVAANGDISVDYEFGKIEVMDDPQNPSPLAATLETMMKPMKGSKGTSVISNRGLTKKGEFTPNEGLAPQLKTMLDGMKDSIDKLSAPLPVEAVGVGGKWKVVQNLVLSGMKIKQTSTFELKSRTATGFETEVSLKQEADEQDVKSPLLPPGAKMSLESLTGKGNGTSTYKFTSIVPMRVKMQSSNTADMTVTVGDKKQKLNSDTQVEVSMESGK